MWSMRADWMSSALYTNVSCHSGLRFSWMTLVWSVRDPRCTTVYGSDKPLLSAARNPLAETTCTWMMGVRLKVLQRGGVSSTAVS